MSNVFRKAGEHEDADQVVSDFIAQIQPAGSEVIGVEVQTDVASLVKNWLRLTFDQASDYIFIKDRQSRFVMANKMVASDLGLISPAYLLGKSDFDFHSKELAEKFYTDEQEIMRSGKPKVDYEEVVFLKNGSERWMATSKYPLRSSTGEVVGLVGICRDISIRRQAEELARGQGRILEMIATGEDLFAVLEQLVSLTESQLNGVWGSILLLDDEGRRLFHGAAPSLPKGYCDAINGVAIGPAVGSCGTAAYLGKTVIVEDIATDVLWNDYKDLAMGFGLRSCWSTPILSCENKVLGTFAMYTGDVAAPGEREKRLIADTTRIAAIAIERHRSEQQIRHIASHDTLTGLPNRRDLGQRLEEMTQEPEGCFSVIFFDLDRFKSVNDCFGHTVGDLVLQTVSKRVRECISKDDLIFRFGGDEFVLIIQGEKPGSPRLTAILEKISQVVAAPIQIDDQAFHVTSSMGIASWPQDGDTPDTLLLRADNAMYKAKESGRDMFRYYEHSMETGGPSRMMLLEDLRGALERSEFVLDYQPQFDLKTGSLCGVEALIRWEHPRLGRLLPGVFIPLAEDSGFIRSLGRWVLNEACRQARAWQNAGCELATVGVNVSAQQFRDAGWIDDVLEALAASELKPGCLELELTESHLVQNGDHAVEVMRKLRDIGVGLAIDDFGTGYSSLSALSELPLNRLKIDRSFIEKTATDEKARGIAQTIVTLSSVLGLDVVGEGVESREQLDFLKAIGCDKAQGYFLGRPMPADEISRLMIPSLEASAG